jgi:hypothetical protein
MTNNEIEQKNSNTLAFVTFIFMLLTAIFGFIVFDVFFNKHQLSKNGFICTKIEQVGKNLDDVICVQYTAQKHYEQAVSLNRTSITAASYMGNR